MSIVDKLKDDMKSAMRAKEKVRLTTIRLVLAKFKQYEIDEGRAVDDEIALNLLDNLVKQRRESIKQYQAANRPELAEQEQVEIDVIQTYLPEPLDDSAIEELIAAAVKESGAQSMKDMGQVMAILKPQLQGRADMGQVSGKVKAALSA